MSDDDTTDQKPPAPSVLDAMSHGRRGLAYGFAAGALFVVLVSGAWRHHEVGDHMDGHRMGGHHREHHGHGGQGYRHGDHPWCEQMHEHLEQHLRMMGADGAGHTGSNPLWPEITESVERELGLPTDELHEQMREQLGHRSGNSVEGPQG